MRTEPRAMVETKNPDEDLLDHKRNVYSQNGEDGIIKELFRRIGAEWRTCCEFGAWDGIFASNCRNLILNEGWRAAMIEADSAKAKTLAQTYRDNPAVTCVQRLVAVGENSLSSILTETGFPRDLDFLSVDIDGLDYEIFDNLDLRPRVLCIEVNAAFPPDSEEMLPREVAAKVVGQPMGVFMRIAHAKGYALVCYSGNAFFVREDIVRRHDLKVLTPADAYDSFLGHLEPETREWIWLVNRGLIPPYRRYHNSRLMRKALGIPVSRWLPLHWLAAKRFAVQVFGWLRSRLGRA